MFPETGGDACIYVEPESTDEMLHALETVLGDRAAADGMRARGAAYARNVREPVSASNLTAVYRSLL